MHISVEISYYPLTENIEEPINRLLELFKTERNITFEIGAMSTLISGEYDIVMGLLNSSMKKLMKEFPSVFNLKIANACEVK